MKLCYVLVLDISIYFQYTYIITSILILTPTEILTEVRNNGNGLSELLAAGVEKLDPGCLNEALIIAVENDHHQNVGKLIVKGATNISEALRLALNNKKMHASAMLMLISAATDGNCNLIRQLYEDIGIDELPCQDCSRSCGGTRTLISKMVNNSKVDIQDCLCGVSEALIGSNIPTTIPIEIARRSSTTPLRAKRCADVREELLMKTDVNLEDKSVDWQGLGLRSIELSWMKRVDWVKSLSIGRNQLKVLPAQMEIHMKQVGLFFFQCFHASLPFSLKCFLYNVVSDFRMCVSIHQNLLSIFHNIFRLQDLTFNTMNWRRFLITFYCSLV